jgi:uncharacterized protein YndB with AHSA1/START domain
VNIQDVFITRRGGGYRLEYSEVYATGIDDLWSAVTQPERLRRWMAEYVGEFRLGGEWQALAGSGKVWCFGTVTECDPPHRFVTTWTHHGEPETVIEVALESVDGGTLLRLSHGDLSTTDYGPGWHTYLLALGDSLADPAADRDDEKWKSRYIEFEPAYRQRFAEL